LTDLAKHVFGGDNVLEKKHFDVERLRELIAEYRPRTVAFTSTRAAAEFVGHPVDYGLLAATNDATRLFVLPSPSGAARRHWNAAYWQELSLLRSTGP
jgi:TDG/mug DNA glycosylase family protein